MPQTRYDIDYVVKSHLADLDKLDARLLNTDKIINKVKSSLKSLGADMPGAKQAVLLLNKLDVELRSKVVDANKAAAALAGVGKDNRAVTALTQRLKDLEAELAKVTAAANASTTALGGVGAGVKLPGTSGTGGGAGTPGSFVGRAAAGMARHVAYAAFRNTVQAAGQGATERREFFSSAADIAGEYIKDLQENAVLEGKTSADPETVRKQLEFLKETKMDPETAKEFRLEYGGAVEASIDAGGMTRETADKLEIEAGKFTARYGLDAKTGGRMAGLLGVTSKVPDVQTGMGIMAEAMEALNIKAKSGWPVLGQTAVNSGQVISIS